MTTLFEKVQAELEAHRQSQKEKMDTTVESFVTMLTSGLEDKVLATAKAGGYRCQIYGYDETTIYGDVKVTEIVKTRKFRDSALKMVESLGGNFKVGIEMVNGQGSIDLSWTGKTEIADVKELQDNITEDVKSVIGLFKNFMGPNLRYYFL